MTTRESVVFLAIEESDKQVIGFVQLYPSFSSISMQRSWILNDLFVLERFRGIGVGKLLLNQAKVHAIQTQSKGLSLETAVNNVSAQRLYEQLGYEKDTSFYNYYLMV